MMCFSTIYVLDFHSSHRRCNASHVKQLLKWLQQGSIVVLVSDAGTPVISDPDMEPLCLASWKIPKNQENLSNQNATGQLGNWAAVCPMELLNMCSSFGAHAKVDQTAGAIGLWMLDV